MSLVASARMYSWSPSLAAAWRRLLAAPVPSPSRYGQRAVYVTDFIVRAGSPYTRLEETFGKTIAYSTEHSHSGYNAPRHHLLAYRTAERRTLYGSVLGPLVRQRPVLDAVVEGRADVAAIDGYALDLLRRHAPDVAARVRVIDTTIPAPSAPLVASPGASKETCDALAAALVEAHTVPELRATLDELLLSRFVRVDPRDFDIFLERESGAEAAGYAKHA